jgi:hypothetical protein
MNWKVIEHNYIPIAPQSSNKTLKEFQEELGIVGSVECSKVAQTIFFINSADYRYSLTSVGLDRETPLFFRP